MKITLGKLLFDPHLVNLKLTNSNKRIYRIGEFWYECREKLRKEKVLIPAQDLRVQVVSNAWKQMGGGYTFADVPNADI